MAGTMRVESVYWLTEDRGVSERRRRRAQTALFISSVYRRLRLNVVQEDGVDVIGEALNALTTEEGRITVASCLY